MILRQTRILVVDDKKDHGGKISQALSDAGYPCRFIHFDPAIVWNEEQLAGVRAVFFDLSLLGSNVVTDNDRAAAQTLLEQVFSITNGPWGLIAWTSHADDAARLYEYLRARLPAGIRPVTHAVLDKEHLLLEENLPRLADEASKALQPAAPISCLLGWENAVQKAAAMVLHQLTEAAECAPGDGKSGDKLECLLSELARAEAGKTLPANTSLAQPLYSVLTPLLADCLEQSESNSCSQPAAQCPESADVGWQHRINRMLHIDPGTRSTLVPGALVDILVKVTEINQLDSLGTTDAKRQSRVRGLFFRFSDATKKEEKATVSSACKLFLLDVTPPCDHSQAKTENENYWRRFVVVCRVPAEHRYHLWRIVKDIASGGERREEGRMHADHLYASPLFSDESGQFLLVVNANLLVSLTRDAVATLPKPTSRIREQLYHHILSWLGRHITRQGIVTVG